MTGLNKKSNGDMSDDDIDFDEDDEYDAEKVEKKAIDQQEKLKLLLQNLEVYCNDESEYDDLRDLGKAVKSGAKLAGTILSGGYTNYSYKIHLDSDGSDNDEGNYGKKEIAVFAKIAFPYALWNPDTSVPYDLDRVTAEFDLMKRFSEELKTTSAIDGSEKSPIPRPYVLIDVPAAVDGTSPRMKIFVAEWVAPTDEQWGNQYIEGEIDLRVVDQCAKTLAVINLADCDDDINQGYVETFAKIAKGFDGPVLAVLDREDEDKAVRYVRDVVGKEKMIAIMKEWHIRNRKKEALVHGDAHVFNMLVERKPNPFQLSSSFGANGDFILCDWEMAHKGHKGRDISNFFSFPTMSACFMAARGQKDKADNIIASLKQFWTTYKTALAEGLDTKQAGSANGDDVLDVDRYMEEVFNSAISFFGYFSFVAFYIVGVMTEYNETEGLTEKEEKHVMGVLGWIGIRSMEVGFLEPAAEEAFGDHDNQRLSRMESFFFGMIEQEINELFEARKTSHRRSRRRSSMLRESSRRVSDSESGFGRMVRRMSQQVTDEN
ncbi:unnamed protein product [Pseudo-nitzschia multistriata]|uniref:Uncharacterized protein n=1 Tax=Pseudo-nitzschia multistriata TaxID=183589 RepID=A0A448ZIU1_9STRA|nr:unnamed protein product [Pseudo-nitzschia multistriata]